MAGTGFHSLSLFGDFLPVLPRPLLDQRQDETYSLRKRASLNLHTCGYKRMAVFADHGVSSSVYKIVCVCWFGIIVSCLDNVGQFAQVIGETVGFGQIVHHDSRISFMSILGCCVTTVYEVSLCVAVWLLSLKKTFTWLPEASHRFTTNIYSMPWNT